MAGVAALRGPSRAAVLAAMTASLAMVFLDQTVVAVALPSIRADLGLSSSEFQWVVNGFLLAVASLAILAGRISDLLGHPRGAAIAMSIFIAGSVLSGAAQSSAWLIASRIVQGAGAAMLTSSTVAIVSDAYPEEHRGRALGIYWGVAGLALSLGPLVGGVLTDAISWRWIFWINPFIALAIAPVLVRLVRSAPRPAYTRARLDLAGAATLPVALTLLVVGLHGLDPALIGAGIVCVAAFIALERRRAEPLIEISLISNRTIIAALLVLALTQPVVIWGAVYIADYLQTVLGYSARGAGLALLPVTLTLLVGSIVGGRATDRFGARVPALVGAAAAGLALVSLGAVVGGHEYLPMAPGLVVLGFAISLTQAPVTTAVMNIVPGEHRAAVSGMLGTGRQIGGSVGLALLSGLVVAEADLTQGVEVALYVGAGFVAAALISLAALMPARGEPRARRSRRPRSAADLAGARGRRRGRS